MIHKLVVVHTFGYLFLLQLLNQNAYCPRQKWLWSMVMKTPEYIKLERSSVVSFHLTILFLFIYFFL